MSGLRERLRRDLPLLAPGVYDALTALLAQQAGFEALYLSGGAVAYTQLGRSDVGLTTASETADVLARITDRVQLPVIVDADTGYGNALNVQRTVRDFERAGAAMIQLEDQRFPKRCGHSAGKTLVSRQEMCGKLRAALDARRSAETLILARTDAVAVESTQAAFERAEAYLECGVDALFIEGLAFPRGNACGVRAFRPPRTAPRQHDRRRAHADQQCGRPGLAGLSHRDLSWWDGPLGRSRPAALLRLAAGRGHHAAAAQPDAGL